MPFMCRRCTATYAGTAGQTASTMMTSWAFMNDALDKSGPDKIMDLLEQLGKGWINRKDVDKSGLFAGKTRGYIGGLLCELVKQGRLTAVYTEGPDGRNAYGKTRYKRGLR